MAAPINATPFLFSLSRSCWVGKYLPCGPTHTWPRQREWRRGAESCGLYYEELRPQLWRHLSAMSWPLTAHNVIPWAVIGQDRRSGATSANALAPRLRVNDGPSLRRSHHFLSPCACAQAEEERSCGNRCPFMRHSNERWRIMRQRPHVLSYLFIGLTLWAAQTLKISAQEWALWKDPSCTDEPTFKESREIGSSCTGRFPDLWRTP